MAEGYSTGGTRLQVNFLSGCQNDIVRSVISIVTAKHWVIHQMNIYNAFVQGDLKKEVYLTLP